MVSSMRSQTEQRPLPIYLLCSTSENNKRSINPFALLAQTREMTKHAEAKRRVWHKINNERTAIVKEAIAF